MVWFASKHQQRKQQHFLYRQQMIKMSIKTERIASAVFQFLSADIVMPSSLSPSHLCLLSPLAGVLLTLSSANVGWSVNSGICGYGGVVKDNDNRSSKDVGWKDGKLSAAGMSEGGDVGGGDVEIGLSVGLQLEPMGSINPTTDGPTPARRN